MSLYIRDNEVDELAVKLQELTGAPTKTEAVRKALENEIERKKAQIPLQERLRRIVDRAGALGLPNADFDMKKFSDELSGEEDY